MVFDLPEISLTIVRFDVEFSVAKFLEQNDFVDYE